MKLQSDGIRRRRETLLERVEADLILITNPRHVLYYSGFHASELSLGGWGPSLLLIDGKGRATLVTHNFSAGALESAVVDHREVWTWYDTGRRSGTALWRDGAGAAQRAVVEQLSGQASPTIGYESGSLPQDVLPEEFAGRLVDVTDAILIQRRQKEPDEIAAIRRAVDICGSAHALARGILSSGMTELELYAALSGDATIAAGERVNLFCDLVSGPRCRGGSGPPTSRKIVDGDTVILDLNPYVGGYRADYTSTLILRPALSVDEEHAEKTLHEALSAGEALLKPGHHAGSVYKAVDHVIREAGYSEGLTHHAGHGIGLGHPEAPYFVPESEEMLMLGDVVTLEPGVYTETACGRIEHNYLITESGPQRLSNHNTAFLLR